MSDFYKPSKTWSIVWNEPETDDEPWYQLTEADFKPNVHYVCWQLEIGEDKGRLHMQLFAEFTKSVRGKQALSELGLPPAARAQHTRRPDKGEAYCMKDRTRIEGPWQFGSRGNQGDRSDIKKAYELMREGKSMIEVLEATPAAYVKYHKGFEKAAELMEIKRQKEAKSEWRDVTVTVHYGPGGTGKTKQAMARLDAYKLPLRDKQDVWFDGYLDQTALIIDEFMPSQWKITQLNQLLDGHRLTVPKKGGFVTAKWTQVHITTNVDPDTWYSGLPTTIRNTLFRRITEILTYPSEQAVESETVIKPPRRAMI